ncbi:peptidoglycan DD-metalloendopeptidase family protein [Denitratisoma sp. agr-D3]
MVTAFGTSPTTQTEHVQQRDYAETLSLSFTPLDSDNQPQPQSFVREERVRPGDTVATLFKRLGIEDDGLLPKLQSQPEAGLLFRQLSPGKLLSARVDDNGQLIALTFPLNGAGDQVLQITASPTGYRIFTQTLPLENQVQVKSAEIRYSLFGATDSAGIPDAIATQLADVFGGDIDFHRDLRKGDRFSVVYETQNYQGRLIKPGKILAAEFINDGKRYRALWFDGGNGKGGYYSPDGKSLRKAFLRSPLEFSRVTSGFSSARFHPVLQTWRAHKGVDYGAPIGTRVRATSDGVVEFIGVQGGYGKVVVLRHQGRYSTLYGHLSAFAAGLRQGSRVSQGDTIAYTGMSGLASGPHLHYEFRVDGVHQNPLTVALPGAPVLTPQQKTALLQLAAPRLDLLSQTSGSNTAALD